MRDLINVHRKALVESQFIVSARNQKTILTINIVKLTFKFVWLLKVLKHT